jgi:predicted CoA-binding protein
MNRPTIAIIGASRQRHKFGNKAVRAYASRGYDVFPIHPREKIIEGLEAYPSVKDVPVAELDRASLYVPPNVGIQLLADLATKKIREVWLNPGSESPELLARGQALGLNIVQGCSIRDIGVFPDTLG